MQLGQRKSKGRRMAQSFSEKLIHEWRRNYLWSSTTFDWAILVFFFFGFYCWSIWFLGKGQLTERKMVVSRQQNASQSLRTCTVKDCIFLIDLYWKMLKKEFIQKKNQKTQFFLFLWGDDRVLICSLCSYPLAFCRGIGSKEWEGPPPRTSQHSSWMKAPPFLGNIRCPPSICEIASYRIPLWISVLFSF